MMSNIIINAINSNSAGGLSVVSNFLEQLSHDRDHNDKYTLVITDVTLYEKFRSERINLLVLPKFFIFPFFNIFTYLIFFWIIAKFYKAEKLLNFGDLIPFVNCKIYYYFDWAFALYNDISIWSRMSIKQRFPRIVKSYLIRKMIKRCHIVICQTEAIKNRLENIVDMNKVFVVPNSAKKNFIRDDEKYKFPCSLEGKEVFLYLTRYYPHKNIEILLELAIKAKNDDKNWVFILTIDERQGKEVVTFQNNIVNLGLCDYFVLVGSVAYDDVYKLYNASHHVILPSLIESFSSMHIEAMIAGKTIFSSDRDFARTVCGESAYYFDPLDAEDIYRVVNGGIKKANNSQALCKKRTFFELSSWEDSYERIKNLIS
ncbi:glycosyltransferase [Vibrio vulnificus]|nr:MULTISPECIES: glycosyltransferase [Vibrio]ELK8588958.1 glycosyltransferase [Vibrio vulnificus]MCJ0818773.1 glycosyltransferase [Vibrio vulnificus]MDC8109754.1 glycosyltransferase [Vibrio sp. CCUG 15886]HAS6358852.1 glycosyltransferase [Vibrio vulnificus]HDZ3736836.1 glycosyltransferase [Vibrio vulnificus]